MEKNGSVLGNSSSFQALGEIFLKEDSPWPKFPSVWFSALGVNYKGLTMMLSLLLYLYQILLYHVQFFCFMDFDGLRKVREASMEILESERRE